MAHAHSINIYNAINDAQKSFLKKKKKKISLNGQISFFFIPAFFESFDW